jgi:sarcosine oxidase, subunit gamma
MHERDWSNRTPHPGDRIEGRGTTITCEAPGGAALISGGLEAAIAALAPGAPFLGRGATVPDAPFALRIARDRALLVTDAPADVASGWHASYAATPADDLYLRLAIEGKEAATIMAAGTGASLEESSPSAMVLFAGTKCLVARASRGFLIWVERPDAAYLWSFLARLLAR